MVFPGNNIQTQEEIMAKAAKSPVQVIRERRATGWRPSLYEFLRMFWNEVAETSFKDNWHVLYLCNQLEEAAKRVARNEPCEKDLVINIPPGTTKTIICSIMFPAWCWASGWYWMRFITASYSATLALESAEKSRDLIKSDKFKAIFPELSIKDDKDTKSNFRIVKKFENGRVRHGGNRFSTSVGGTLTGFHGHILIVDDPLNPEQAASEKELENCNRWMEQTLPTRKVDKEVAFTVLVMQRLHESDPTGRAVKRKPDSITHICLPGELHNYKKYLKPVEVEKYYKDGLLDPARLSKTALKKLEEDLGQYGFAGQVGQNPAPPGGGMFKVDNLSVVDRVDPDDIVRTVRYWDKAATAGGGAYTTGVKMSLLKKGFFVIHDIKRGQWSSEAREKVIQNTAQADGVSTRIYMEQEPGSGGKDSVRASIRDLAGFVVYADRPTGNKEIRADTLSVQVNNGNVWLLRGSWNEALIDELRIFPNGTYKDQVDGCSGSFNMLTGKRLVRIGK